MSLQLFALIQLLADGKFHTGDDLGRVLGVGRSAIWKAIKKVADLGLQVDSVKGKGYRLERALELLDRESLLSTIALTWQDKITELELLGLVDSTNSHVMRRLQTEGVDLSSGKSFICLAEQQSAGRGRRGREWVSPFGHNMYLSVGREFNSGAVGLEGLSLVVGLSLVKALERCGISGLGLKWPNDVQWNSQKLAGILLEMTGDVTGACQVIIGIGLNIRVSQDAMQQVEQPWVDLGKIEQIIPSRNQIIGYIIEELMIVLEEFERRGFAGFVREWEKYDALKGEKVEIVTSDIQKKGNGELGVAEGVSGNGAFLLRTKAGLKSYNGGEVSLRKQETYDS